MNVRAQAVGMASQTQNVANAIVQQFFPTFLDNCGFYAFYMFAGINALLAIFTWFCIPETKKIALEEIDVLFGGSNHVERGADLVGAGAKARGDVEVGMALHPGRFEPSPGFCRMRAARGLPGAPYPCA